MCENGKMTEEQETIWEIGYRYTELMPSPPNEFRIILWKRFTERNLYCDSEKGSELLHLAYHQTGKNERPLRFFESFLIELDE